MSTSSPPPLPPRAAAARPARPPRRAADPRRLRLPRRRARQRDRARAHAELAPVARDVPAHDDRRIGAACRPAATGRWATPKSATSTSARAASSTRTSRGSTTRSRRRVRARIPCCGAVETARARQSTLHVLGLAVAGRRAQPRAADRRDGRAGRAARRARRRARVPRRPRHAAAQRARVAARPWTRVCARIAGARIASICRPLLRDGPRPALGAARRQGTRTRSARRPRPR